VGDALEQEWHPELTIVCAIGLHAQSRCAAQERGIARAESNTTIDAASIAQAKREQVPGGPRSQHQHEQRCFVGLEIAFRMVTAEVV